MSYGKYELTHHRQSSLSLSFKFILLIFNDYENIMLRFPCQNLRQLSRLKKRLIRDKFIPN